MSTESELKKCRKMLRKILHSFAHMQGKEPLWWTTNTSRWDEVDVHKVAKLAYPRKKK